MLFYFYAVVLRLKKIFNWFKLFLAIDILAVSIIMPIAGWQEMQEGENRWIGVLIGFVIFFSVGLSLLYWFFKTHRKLYPPLDMDILESRFYNAFPRLSNVLDGWNFNGFGTKYFSYSNRQPDNSVYATKWITVAFLPIIPLYRERIKIISEKEKFTIPFFISSSRTQFQKMERIKINKRLNVLNLLFYYLIFLGGIISPLILVLIYLKQLLVIFPATRFWWLIVLYFAWGIFLMLMSELWDKRIFLRYRG